MRTSSAPAGIIRSALVAGLAGIILAGNASAQVIEEITVTARKTAESLQDVPLSITAFDADTIREARIRNLEDVAALTPGLSLFNPLGEFLPTPTIRGIAQTDIFGQPNAAVFVDGVFVSARESLNFNFIDVERIEVVKGPQSALYGRNAFSGAINYITKRPLDEPGVKAGVSFGTDSQREAGLSVSGPILGDTLSGRASVRYENFDGTYDNQTTDEEVGGYEYRMFNGVLQWQPSEEWDILANLYYSNDELDPFSASGLSLNCENDVEAGDYPNNRFLAWCGDVPTLEESNRIVGLGDDVINKSRRVSGQDRDQFRFTLNVDWDLEFGTFTSLTGFTNTDENSLTDFNYNIGETAPVEFCEEPLNFGAFCQEPDVQTYGTGILNVQLGDETEEFSQEFRWESPRDRSFRYGVGGIYYDREVDSGGGWPEATVRIEEGQQIGVYAEVARPNFIIPIGCGGTAGDNYRDCIYPQLSADGIRASRAQGEASVIENTTEGFRVFGIADWDFAEDWTLELRLGYTDEDQDIFSDIPVILVINPEGQDCPGGADCPDNPLNDGKLINGNGPVALQSNPVSDGDSWSFWNGRVGLKWTPNDDWMIYGSVANSTKSGALEEITGDTFGPDGNTITQRTSVNSVDEEDLIAYELGAKGTVWDGRLQLDGAVYYNDWSDVVLRSTLDFDPDTGERYLQPEAAKVNAGDADVLGFEFAAQAILNEYWSTRFAVGYQDAEWDKGNLASLNEYPSFGGIECIAPDDPPDPDFQAPEGCGDISGQTMSRQPEWQASLSLSYEVPMDNDWSFFGRGDLTYEDEWFPQDDNLAVIPSHTFLNLRIGVRSDRVTVTAWANNLLDEDDPIATFRDVWVTNTDDIGQNLPLVGRGTQQIYPLRYTVNHPTLRTFGLDVVVRFGGEVQN